MIIKGVSSTERKPYKREGENPNPEKLFRLGIVFPGMETDLVWIAR